MAVIKRIGRDKLGVPIWEAIYRRVPGGPQVRRRFHMMRRGDVERAVLLDSRQSGIGMTWSEGFEIYLQAKKGEGKAARSLENVDRAVRVFVELAGDIAIEDTTSELFKDFLQRAAARPVNHKYAGKKLRTSGPKVANHHRRELLAVGRYLLRHAGKVAVLPFERVPPLPVKVQPREPIGATRVNDYLDALPPHVRRPVLMVLYYGLRSSAACNVTLDSIDGGELRVIDKGGVKRRIPVDDTLAGIVAQAMAYREELVRQNEEARKAKPGRKPLVLGDRLFVTARGKGWNRGALLHAAQKAWDLAGLEKKKIHEVRHTLGTMAGKYFTKGMVQAAMGHRSEKSSAQYFHPTEEMAAEVRQKIITELSQNFAKGSENSHSLPTLTITKDGEYSCPCCSSKFLIIKEKGRKP